MIVKHEMKSLSALKLIILILMADLLIPGVLHAQPQASPVRAVKVQKTLITEQRLITGELKAAQRAMVASLEGGRVIAAPVEAGDIVEKGTVLALLDDERLQLQLRSAKAKLSTEKSNLVEKQAQLEKALRDEARLKELFDQHSATENEYKDSVSDRLAAQARRDQAAADVDLADAELALIKRRISDMTITAPFRAAIVRKLVDVGDWVGTGTAVAEVIAVGKIEAYLYVPETYLAAVSGKDVLIPLKLRSDGRMLTPTHPRVIRDVDPVARTFSLVVPLVKEEAEKLAPGMSITGWVPTGFSGEHLVIPRDALLQNSVGHYVYIATQTKGDSLIADQKQVQILFETGDKVAVGSGAIKAGDLVIVEGNERLYPGASITLVNDLPDAPQQGE